MQHNAPESTKMEWFILLMTKVKAKPSMMGNVGSCQKVQSQAGSSCQLSVGKRCISLQCMAVITQLMAVWCKLLNFYSDFVCHELLQSNSSDSKPFFDNSHIYDWFEIIAFRTEKNN